MHAYQSGRPYNPAICGHEWCGTVSAVGGEVVGLREGDRVVVGAAPACGRCAACRAGQAERCQTAFLSAVGRDALAPPHGGFAPRLAVAADRVVRTHPSLTDEQAAQVEPATVAFHAVRASPLRLGDTAVVQGAGPIGLLTMQWVRAAGAGRVIVIEPSPLRQELAGSLGADVVVASRRCGGHDRRADPRPRRRHRLRVRRAAVRHPARRRPHPPRRAVCMIGLPDADATISPGVWLVKEVAFSAALAYFHEEFEMSMGMMADGRVRVEPLHTSTVGLGGLDAALADLAAGQSAQTKVLVDPLA